MVTPYPTRGVVTASDLSTDSDVFPQLPGELFLASRAPNWSTGLHRTRSLRSIRTSFVSSPTYTFKVQHEFLRDGSYLEVQKLLAFFNSRRGSFGSFFYLDKNDYQVTDEPMGTGDGSKTTFQAVRTIGRGTTWGITTEPVYAFWTAPTFKVSGSTVSATVNPWGQIVFASAPAAAAPITWSGKFLWVCAFTQDKLDMAQLVSQLWSQDGLEFESLRP